MRIRVLCAFATIAIALSGNSSLVQSASNQVDPIRHATHPRALSLPPSALQYTHPFLTRFAKRIGEVDFDSSAFQVNQAASQRAVRSSRFAVAAGGRVSFELFPGEQFNFIGTHIEESAEGIVTWTGVPEANEYGHASITTRGTQVRGTIDIGTRRFTLRDGPGGRVFVREVDHKSIPSDKDHADSADRAQSKNVAATKTATPSAKSASGPSRVFDVLVLYTSTVQSNNGGDPSVTIANFISDLNTSFDSGGVDAAGRVIHTALLQNYSEPSGMTTSQHVAAVTGMRDNVSPFQSVEALRDSVQADLVVLLVAPGGVPEVCGYSLIPATTDDSDASYATVDETCATTDYTFSHEVGHNVWGHHDWPRDGTSQPSTAVPLTNHGYTKTFDVPFRTMMGVSNFVAGATDLTCDTGDGCPRLLRWSTPNQSVTLGGNSYPLGVGPPNTTDMVTALGTSVSFVAAYRSASISVPSTPAAANVYSLVCYGANEMTWSPVTLNTEYYQVQSSTSSSYTSPVQIYTGPSTELLFDVTGTRYLRVRACNTSSGCGGWRNATGVASYYPGCA